MIFEEQITHPMKRLAHKLVDSDKFAVLENISNFMIAIQSNQWSQLPSDEQSHWLTQLDGLLGLQALGSIEGFYEDPDLRECQTIIKAQLKAIEKII